MLDNKLKTRPQDATRINIHEYYEVIYWTEKYNCTKEQLESAVEAVGTSAEAVEKYLKK